MSDFPTATVNSSGSNYFVTHGSDKNLFVEIYKHPVRQEPFIRMVMDSKSEINRPISEFDKQRFADKWDRFQSGENQFKGETLIKDWKEIGEHQKTELMAKRVQTVEQLANLSESVFSTFGPGIRNMVALARNYLDAISVQRNSTAALEELHKRDAKIGGLEEMVKSLEQKIAQLATAQAAPQQVKQPDSTLHVPKK